MPVSQEALLDLIDRLYGASLEPEGWPGIADHLTRLLGGVSCMLHIRDPAIEVVAANVDPSAASAYAAHYAPYDLWTQAVTTAPPGVVHLVEDLVPEAALARSAFYNDFLRSYDDTFHCIGGGLRLDRGAAFFGVHRTRRMGGFGASQQRALGVLLPHLQRALILRKRFAALALEQRMREAALDTLATGLMIVNAEGAVLFANAAARAIAAAQDGLLITSGGLSAARHEQTRSLRARIAKASTRPTRLDAGSAMRLARPSGRREYMALVTPLPAQYAADLTLESAALVTIIDPDREPIAPERLLIELFGLTAAEARIAVALARGRDPTTAADALGVSINTVRTQISRAYAKTDRHRQSELVSLVLRLTTLSSST